MLASIFAEMELKRIKARVTAAHKHLRETDRWAGGQPPYGYRIADRPGGGRTLEPDPVISEASGRFPSRAPGPGVRAACRGEPDRGVDPGRGRLG
ncbi:hypothetical protein ACFVUY_08235 [Kitasatospora sp. NPDC058063]|uniref:hypothetical protein n=1 Tax=unclassified Kitasatospora TaxID=2633591 RepID=UPI0036D78CFB